MSKIQQQIVEEFCRRLEGSPEFSPRVVEELRKLLCPGRKPKAADVVKALSTLPTDDVS